MSGNTSGARSLKTAATVLRALRLLGQHPDGLTAAELGDRLGKSAATARYMVNTLCETGYALRDTGGRYRLADAPPWGVWSAVDETADLSRAEAAPGAVLAEAVTDLYRRTRQRSYLVRRTGLHVASVCDVRGHQGLARLPGLETHVPPAHAHATAMTKVLLAASPRYREAVTSECLAALTPRTVTDVDALGAELDEVRARGFATDDEEFAPGFATIAAPILSPTGTSTVAVGLSCSTRRFAVDRDDLVAAVVAVAEAARQQWEGSGTAGSSGAGDVAGTVGGGGGGEDCGEGVAETVAAPGRRRSRRGTGWRPGRTDRPLSVRRR